jgi:hypothetical protein
MLGYSPGKLKNGKSTEQSFFKKKQGHSPNFGKDNDGE